MPVSAILLAALGVTYLSVSVEAPRFSIVPFFEEGEMKAVIANTLFFVSMASLNILFFYLALKKGYVFLLEKIFAMGGALLTFFVVLILTMNLFKMSSSLLVLVVTLISLIVGVFLMIISAASLAIDIFSEETRTIIFMTYCSVAGSFLGMGIPVYSMILVIVSLCAIDILFIRTRVMKDLIDHKQGQRIFVILRYSDRELMIGLGDLIFYSMLASYSLVNFGALTAAVSTLLILIGSCITFLYTRKLEILPGLPIPVSLGLIPIAVRLVAQAVALP